MKQLIRQSLLVLVGVSFLAIPTCSPRTVLAQTSNSTAQNILGQAPTASSSSLTVIHGTVLSIQGNKATVRTADIRSVCQPHHICAQSVIAGVTFNVDTSGAVFESADGTPNSSPVSDLLSVGEAVIVAGQQSPIISPFGKRVLQAQVVQQNI